MDKDNEKDFEKKERTGKDELNLIDLPFTLLSTRNSRKLKTIERNWIGRNKKGQEQNFYKIITGSDKWGLPTFIGEELYIACMELAYRQDFKSKTIHTNKRQILDLMYWGHGGLDYKRLMKGFDQLGGVWIKTNAFWDNASKEHKEVGFGIIDSYMFSQEDGFFNWNEMFFDFSLNQGNVKTLDTALYFSLKTPTSKRLFRYADKKLYNNEIFELDLYRLAFEKLEMTHNYRYPSDVIVKLKPTIRELKERNIVNIQIKESKTKSGYKVCFYSINKTQIAVVQKPEIKMETEPAFFKKPSKATELVQLFHSFFDPHLKDYQPTKRELQQVGSLLIEYGDEKTEYIINFAVKQAEKTNFPMAFFGAVMGYVDKALSQFDYEQEDQEQCKAEEKENISIQDFQYQYMDYQKEEINRFIDNMSQDQYQQELKEVEEELFKKYPQARDYEEKILKETLKANYFRKVGGRITMLSFEQWQKEKMV